MDLETFERRKAGLECPMCPDTTGEDVIAALPSGHVHLQPHRDYRGYCILVCRRHVVELLELTQMERQQWIEDIARIGQAITAVCRPAKLNVAMLGNRVPHLHCHVIPRYPEDPAWGNPPDFRAPQEDARLSEAEFRELRAQLRAQLQSD
ncbi:MAG: HIT family protein [Chloroherpetonaceae bacterium]|nr:HIT family protein [Chloroherpetonaceae bacterium]